MKLELLTEVKDAGATVHLLVRLHATAPSTVERTAVNLALVIDRSSSMRGPRLAQAVSAARSLIEQLGPSDRVSVITFDAAVNVVFGPAAVTDDAKRTMLDGLSNISSGVGTNIGAGIKKGAEVIQRGFVRGATSRLILLTDGQPSVGLTDIDRLSSLVRKEHERGVTLTTMGLGIGFDDEMLAELATCGKGGFYYLAEPSDIRAAFGRELAGVFTIAARAAELKLIPHTDITSVEVVHRLPSRPLPDGLQVELGEIATDAPRHVLFKLGRDPNAAGTRCGTIMLTYRNPDGSQGDPHLLGIETPSNPLSESIQTVTLERLRLGVATAVDLVWARRASGDVKRALDALGSIKKEVAQANHQRRANAAALAELLSQIAEAEQAVAKSASERAHARRSIRERSHITMLGYSTMAPNDDES